MNPLGTAKRSPNKNTRYSTHVPVLEHCVKMSSIPFTHVIEHGMGLASTPMLHAIESVTKILSFENDVKWQQCNTCNESSNSRLRHIIASSDRFLSLLRDHIEPETTLGLVDGRPGDERIFVLQALQVLGVPYIVEHDAEAWPEDVIKSRCEISIANGYQVLQYVGLNPETLLYTKFDVDDVNDYVQLIPTP